MFQSIITVLLASTQNRQLVTKFFFVENDSYIFAYIKHKNKNYRSAYNTNEFDLWNNKALNDGTVATAVDGQY